VRYIDPDTERIIAKRVYQAESNWGYNVAEPGQYKKRNVTMHHEHCWMCQEGKHPKRRILLPIDIEEILV
jgi:hypothetical protein